MLYNINMGCTLARVKKKLYLCKLLLACYVMRLNVKIRKQHKF